ncbi:hypothetical protein IRJ41_024016 [Triplophysa rosa]|uniref:Uncharacterized protein n=1 Tax=Triplophysa rosa TaxID=992332 RepID=A0A9W7X4W1_TRIRA|nr:hypothetical protein IRJ41_024016 [Triplophysa rosa]
MHRVRKNSRRFKRQKCEASVIDSWKIPPPLLGAARACSSARIDSAAEGAFPRIQVCSDGPITGFSND